MLVGVYGPCGVRTNRELHDRAMLDVTVQYSISRPDNHTALIKRVVTCVCENSIKLDTHPHTAISIAVFIKKEDKYLLPCVLTACCVALLDAGVTMTNTFAAVTLDPHSLTSQVCWSLYCVTVHVKASWPNSPKLRCQCLFGKTYL